MNDVSGGRRPAQRWPGSGGGPRGRQPDRRPSLPRGAPGRRRRAFPAVLAAALTGAALLVTACGGGNGGPVSAKQANYQKLLAYSQCMRAHGEPGFPDPQPDGNLLINGPKDHLNGALMNSASKACKHLMPKSPPLTASQQQKLTAQALKFVACMRTHGIPNFPDPTVNSRGIEMQIPSSVTPNSAVFKNAQQACKNLVPIGPS